MKKVKAVFYVSILSFVFLMGNIIGKISYKNHESATKLELNNNNFEFESVNEFSQNIANTSSFTQDEQQNISVY